jgi:hypothetical protein
VKKVDVSFKNKTAVVVYDSDKTSPQKVADWLSKATNGRYTAQVLPQKAESGK